VIDVSSIRVKILAATVFGVLLIGLLVPTLALAMWTTPVELSAAGQDAFHPQVAVDADGDAVFVWRRSDGTKQRIETVTRTADGALSPVRRISKGGQDAVEPHVGVDQDGNAVFAWTRFDGTNDRVQTRTLSAGGTLGAIQSISPGGQNAAEPEVAVEADGDAVFVWRRSDGVNQRIETVTRSANGTLSAVRTISDAGQNASDPHVGVDADGDAVFTWMRSDGTNDRVQARTLSAGGALGPVPDLSRGGRNASLPQVAVDPGGDAVFSWKLFNGTNYVIQAHSTGSR
jgi:hypothetical protein